MPGKHVPDTSALFEAILSLRSPEECEQFFKDLCTMKELADMVQRLKVAQMLLEGCTYDAIVKEAEISSATISRINRCIQYGDGGYASVLSRLKGTDAEEEGEERDEL
jgi:TrpR-related protein YerC/YecD